MAPVHWRVATWNLDWWARNPRRKLPWELICEAKADVFALQEVRGSEIRTLREHHTGISIFSQEVYPPATLRWMGCGLLLPAGTDVLDVGVIDELPKPPAGSLGLRAMSGARPLHLRLLARTEPSRKRSRCQDDRVSGHDELA